MLAIFFRPRQLFIDFVPTAASNTIAVLLTMLIGVTLWLRPDATIMWGNESIFIMIFHGFRGLASAFVVMGWLTMVASWFRGEARFATILNVVGWSCSPIVILFGFGLLLRALSAAGILDFSPVGTDGDDLSMGLLAIYSILEMIVFAAMLGLVVITLAASQKFSIPKSILVVLISGVLAAVVIVFLLLI